MVVDGVDPLVAVRAPAPAVVDTESGDGRGDTGGDLRLALGVDCGPAGATGERGPVDGGPDDGPDGTAGTWAAVAADRPGGGVAGAVRPLLPGLLFVQAETDASSNATATTMQRRIGLRSQPLPKWETFLPLAADLSTARRRVSHRGGRGIGSPTGHLDR